MRFLLPILTLCLGCFGGLDNRPIEPGPTEVFGTLEGALSEGAFVSVVGRRELSSSIDAGGRFRISGIPSGHLELAASDGEARAAVTTVRLYQARAREITFEMRPAVRIAGRVLLEEAFDDGRLPTVRVAGLPVSVETDAEGHFLLPGLPADCHDVIVEHPDFVRFEQEACGNEGETVAVDRQLRHDSPHQSAVCGPCHQDSECESGLCVEGDWVCLHACADMHTCPRGFECREVQGRFACVPPFTTCAALRDLVRRAGCDGSGACGLHGRDDGVCAPDGHCSVPCDDEHHCPEGFGCHGVGTDHQLCVPN